MLGIMSLHRYLLSLGLAASLSGAAHAADFPFLLDPNPAPQLALRLTPGHDEAEREDSEGAAAPPCPPGVSENQETTEGPVKSGESEPPADPLPPGEESADASEREDGPDLERNPELARQMTVREKRDEALAQAEMALGRMDEILLDAGTQARQDEEHGQDDAESPPGDETLPQHEEAEPESEAEPGRPPRQREVAEGQVPGNAPTGKTRAARGYDEDDDIVSRQICELAEQEEDPEVKEKLEEECETLAKE